MVLNNVWMEDPICLHKCGAVRCTTSVFFLFVSLSLHVSPATPLHLSFFLTVVNWFEPFRLDMDSRYSGNKWLLKNWKETPG